MNAPEVESDIAVSKAQCIAVWQAVLSNLLGWPEVRIERFVAGWSAPDYGMGSPDFYHTHPLEFLTRLLIPDSLTEALCGRPLLALDWDFESAVFPEAMAPDFPPADYDWARARERAIAFLAERGATLPKLPEVSAAERRILDLLSHAA